MVALLKMPLRQPLAHDDERRMFPRNDCHRRVQGCRMDHTIAARRQPYLSLAMRDISAGGLCATTHARLELGEEVAVFFPPEGSTAGGTPAATSSAASRRRSGYQIALSFDHTPLAA